MRILPGLICIFCLLLIVKTGDIWRGISQSEFPLIGEAVAAGKQDKPAEDGSKKDEAKKAAAAPPVPSGDPKPPPPVSGEKTGRGDEAPEDPRTFTLSEIRLLQALAKRRKVLDERERELAQRQALLKAAEQQLVDRQAEMRRIKKQLEQLLQLVDKKEENKINKLVKVYENMKPRDAAVIFNELDHGVLLDVVERMKVRKAAPVIAAMNPDKARRLTRSLATRRKSTEKGGQQEASLPGK